VNRNLLIGAVALLVVLGAAYYLVDIRGREAAEAEDAAGRLLVAPFDVAQARDVVIEPATGPVVRLRRDGADAPWTVEETSDRVAADPDAVQRLFETLERLSVTGEDFAPGDDGLSAYGLAPPRLLLTVSGAAGAELARLALGDAAPLGGARYAMVRDTGQVGLVGADAAMIPQTAFDLRDRQLVRFQRDDVREIRITVADAPEVVMVREGDDWRIDEPFDFAADRELVGDLLWELAECRAQAFPGGAGDVDGTAGRLRLLMNEGPEAEVRFDPLGDSETSLLAMGPSGEVMAVEDAILETLRRPARAWRQLRPFPRYAWEVERITVGAGAAEPVTWRRGADGSWQAEGATSPAETPESDFRQAIELLTALEACAVLDTGEVSLATLGLDRPSFVVTLGGVPEESGPGESLELGFPGGELPSMPVGCEDTAALVAGMRPGAGWVYLISVGSREELRGLLQRLSAARPQDGPGGE
jgi:hypothetical protein